MGKAVMEHPVLVLGVGNTLRGDDGVGVHVIDALRRCSDDDPRGRITCRDGGTLGLSLLPEIEQTDALVIVDAVEMGAVPGEVRSYEGAAMDALLANRRGTAHEVAMADLMAAAQLAGHRPGRRALIGVQPASVGWSLEPSDAVSVAIPSACAAVLSVIERWDHDI